MYRSSAAVLFAVALFGLIADAHQPPPFPTVDITSPSPKAVLAQGGFTVYATYSNLLSTDTLTVRCSASDGTPLCAATPQVGGGYLEAAVPTFDYSYTGTGYIEVIIVRNGVPTWADTIYVTFQ